MKLRGNLDLLNNEIKRFRIDILSDDPTELISGKIWFNSTQKLLKYYDGYNIVVIGSGDSSTLGIPSDFSWSDGLLFFTPNTKISDAIDNINEILKELAPENAYNLSTELQLLTNNEYVRVSNLEINLPYILYGQKYNCVNYQNVILYQKDILYQFADADKGVLKLYYNDVEIDSINLENLFNENYRDSQQIYTPYLSDYLEILEIKKYNNFKLYQKGVFRINNLNLKLNGYIGGKIQVKHIIDNQEYSTAPFFIFYDENINNPNIENDILIVNQENFKYLSGVKFYHQNSTVKYNFTVQNLFNNTYYDDVIFLISNELENDIISINEIPNISYPVPKYNDIVNITNKILTLKNNIVSDKLELNVLCKKPLGRNTVKKYTFNNFLINTYNQMSGDKVEYFQDEVYRLPKTFNFDSIVTKTINVWDSVDNLINGDAQVFNGSLIYPQTNYNIYTPMQNVDYSTFIGDQEYYRQIILNRTTNNGILEFTGENFNNIDLYIKFPTQTGWLNLKKLFNLPDFTGSDNDGCAINIINALTKLTINWTISTFSSYYSNNIYYIKVVLKNKNAKLTKIEEIG